MMLTMIDQKATKVSGWLALIAIASLATSWALHTPDLSKKADQLQQVQATTIQVLKKKLAVATCERGKALDVAGQAVAAANDDSVPVPDLKSAKTDADCVKKVAAPKASPLTR